jgi:predicted nucleic acid-binding Zn ribbon protein
VKTLPCALPDCGTPFERFPGSRRRYCSNRCQGIAARRTVEARYGSSLPAAIRPTVPPLELHCSMCGSCFATADPLRRTCSAGCRHRLTNEVNRRTSPYAARQAEVLAELERARGDWVRTGELAAAVYGADDEANRQAILAVLWRLRGRRADGGRRIESGGGRVRLVSGDDGDIGEVAS